MRICKVWQVDDSKNKSRKGNNEMNANDFATTGAVLSIVGFVGGAFCPTIMVYPALVGWSMLVLTLATGGH